MSRKLLWIVVALSVIAVVLFVQAAPQGLDNQFVAAQPGTQWIGRDTGPVGGSLKASVEQFFAQIKISGGDFGTAFAVILAFVGALVVALVVWAVLCCIGRKYAPVVLLAVVVLVIVIACQ